MRRFRQCWIGFDALFLDHVGVRHHYRWNFHGWFRFFRDGNLLTRVVNYDVDRRRRLNLFNFFDSFILDVSWCVNDLSDFNLDWSWSFGIFYDCNWGYRRYDDLDWYFS